jgi:uncharacterized protein with HEPN domain
VNERIPTWLDDLRRALEDAAILVERGRDAYDRDIALPLAFEALSNRVGDLAKRLVAADPERFGEAIWTQAARNRDFVVHQYHQLDRDALWVTVSVDFPRLEALIRQGSSGTPARLASPLSDPGQVR